ncbi:MAG: hypothetical protein COV10_03770 [Candidatus Vogelbacteria bacterium CG10_big_fil_rev_8_21_14_0_10_51_16]|uniref:Uncharacterized protein n=1 Tax=Candidatus Vogelbacteria bacterium CG10_big_fil_rev_8_21_14_0_10_51_16 TaxID=1975045 RepID=A0A2H0REZ0_9BACT|nr:MAG: hypothetical protein COV10_03770 [Candidatus Vogelbacteria bacterium CG10_big_fil_rev_8_21_14_0_10_51_16]
MTPEQIKQLHAQIIRELELETFPPTVQESMLAEIGQNIFMAVQAALLSALPDTDQDTYMSLIEAGEHETALSLLKKHIPNVDTFVAQAAADELRAFKETERQVAEQVA